MMFERDVQPAGELKPLNGVVMDCYSHPKGGWSATVHFDCEVPVGIQLCEAPAVVAGPRMCRACEVYGPDQHPCCGEVDGVCVFEVEDPRAPITQVKKGESYG